MNWILKLIGIPVPEAIETKQISLWELYIYATPVDFLLLAVGAVGAVISGAALPLMSIIFGSLIDILSNYSPGVSGSKEFQKNVNSYALYFVYLATLSFVTTYMFTSTYIFVGHRQAHKIREEYLSAVLRQEISWFDSLGSGEITTRITSDTNLVQTGISEKAALVIQDISTFICGFVVAFAADWLLTLIVCSIVPFLAIAILLFNHFAGKYTTKGLEIYSFSGTLAEEAISSIKTVSAFNQQNSMIKAYNECLLKAERYGVKKSLSIAIGLSFVFFFIYCGYSIAFYVGGNLILKGRSTAGTVISVFNSILVGSFSLANIAPNLQAISVARGAAAKLFDAIKRKSDIDANSVQGIIPLECFGEIEFKNVCFAYPSRKDVPIFVNYNLKIENEKSVALIGSSGSGKSTIVQLLERFYDPDSGDITLDKNPIKNINVKWLRQQIGLVSQEPILFMGTIAENVASGLIGTKYEHRTVEEKMEQIMNACKISNAHDFISSLPSKYDTQVGERGFLLSGGQKQRIAIARAIVKNPMILLLDEATSALDTKSEVIVQDALDKASRGRTTIIVAHRLSTIRDCNKIVVMDRGVITEAGSHDELMKIPEGAYRRLVEIQDIKKAVNQNNATSPLQKNLIDDYVELESESGCSIIEDPVSRRFSTRSKHSDIEGKQIPASLYNLAKKTWNLNKSEKIYYFYGYIGAISQGCAYPVFGIFFSKVIVAFSKTGEELRTAATFWSLMVLLIGLGLALGNVCQSMGFNVSAEKLGTKLRLYYFESLLRQEIGFFDIDTNTTGALVSQISSDAQDVLGISGATLGLLLQALVNLILSMVVGFLYGWKLALVVTACLPILLSAGYLNITMITQFQRKNKKAYSKSAEIACEAAASIRTVASLTKEQQICKVYHQSLKEPMLSGYKTAFISSLVFAMSQSASFLVNALAFWYGSTLLKSGEYNISKMFTVYMSLVSGTTNVSKLFAYSPDLNKAKEAARSLFGIIERTPIIKNCGNLEFTKENENPSGMGSLKFENVEFSYPTRKNVKVLKGISFDAKPGQLVALVGPSGCGKSTTISLIERFYDNNKGEIFIDGVNINEYNLTDLRNNISLVSQEPSLYNMTIKENILFGLSNVNIQKTTDQLVINACKEANIHDFIMSLPKGYDTNLGGKGSQLSGGQKQRIAIARALIRNPRILLLDEATSALDAQSEKIVQEALNKAAKGRTTLSIAHRLSTIQEADLILVFKDGYIVERGNHSTLLKMKGLYYEMIQQQILDKPNS